MAGAKSFPPEVPPPDGAAAPPAWKPLSVLCVVSLVLALLGVLPALLGLWWSQGVALIAAVLGFATTRPVSRRGKGLAIAAGVIAVVTGAGSFMLHRRWEMEIEEHLDGLVNALDRGDRAKAATWTADPATADASVARWVERTAAVQATLGRYKGRLVVGNVFWGFAAAVVRPPDLTEVEPRGAGDLGQGQALWARAEFERGTAWFAFEGGEPDRPGAALEAVVRDGIQRSPPRWVRDVRIFRSSP